MRKDYVLCCLSINPDLMGRHESWDKDQWIFYYKNILCYITHPDCYYDLAHCDLSEEGWEFTDRKTAMPHVKVFTPKEASQAVLNGEKVTNDKYPTDYVIFDDSWGFNWKNSKCKAEFTVTDTWKLWIPIYVNRETAMREFGEGKIIKNKNGDLVPSSANFSFAYLINWFFSYEEFEVI